MTEDDFRQILRAELTPMQEQLGFLRRDVVAMQPHVAGIPLINRAIEALRHESRQIKVAVNDLAAIQMTAGEAEALHGDVDKTMTRQDELEARLLIVERLIKELQNGK